MNRWDKMPAPDTERTEAKSFVLIWPEDGWQCPPMTEQTARDVFMAVNGAFPLQLAIIEGDRHRVLLSWQ